MGRVDRDPSSTTHTPRVSPRSTSAPSTAFVDPHQTLTWPDLTCQDEVPPDDARGRVCPPGGGWGRLSWGWCAGHPGPHGAAGHHGGVLCRVHVPVFLLLRQAPRRGLPERGGGGARGSTGSTMTSRPVIRLGVITLGFTSITITNYLSFYWIIITITITVRKELCLLLQLLSFNNSKLQLLRACKWCLLAMYLKASQPFNIIEVVFSVFTIMTWSLTSSNDVTKNNWEYHIYVALDTGYLGFCHQRDL